MRHRHLLLVVHARDGRHGRVLAGGDGAAAEQRVQARIVALWQRIDAMPRPRDGIRVVISLRLRARTIRKQDVGAQTLPPQPGLDAAQLVQDQPARLDGVVELNAVLDKVAVRVQVRMLGAGGEVALNERERAGGGDGLQWGEVHVRWEGRRVRVGHGEVRGRCDVAAGCVPELRCVRVGHRRLPRGLFILFFEATARGWQNSVSPP